MTRATAPAVDIGRRLIPTEVELKLAAPAPELQKLKYVLLAVPTIRSEVKGELTSTYYDTSDLALRRKELTLRVRKAGTKLCADRQGWRFHGSDLLVRREWEDPIAGKRQDQDIDAPKTGT